MARSAICFGYEIFSVESASAGRRRRLNQRGSYSRGSVHLDFYVEESIGSTSRPNHRFLMLSFKRFQRRDDVFFLVSRLLNDVNIDPPVRDQICRNVAGRIHEVVLSTVGTIIVTATPEAEPNRPPITVRIGTRICRPILATTNVRGPSPRRHNTDEEDRSSWTMERNHELLPPESRSELRALQFPLNGRSVNNEQDRKDCTICLDELIAAGVDVSHMPCGRGFHTHCLEKWLEQQKRSCPLCRYSLSAE